MIDALIERFSWYYALVAAAIFGLIYILEVKLGKFSCHFFFLI